MHADTQRIYNELDKKIKEIYEILNNMSEQIMQLERKLDEQTKKNNK